MKYFLALISSLVILLSTRGQVGFDERMDSILLRRGEVVPRSLDDWIASLDSLLSDDDKSYLERIDLNKYSDREWASDIMDYSLSSDFLERMCLYYASSSEPPFLYRRDICTTLEMYDLIIRAYIKHLKGEPYKYYYDFNSPQNIEEFIDILDSGGWPEAVEFLKNPIDGFDLVLGMENKLDSKWDMNMDKVIYGGTSRTYFTRLAKSIEALDTTITMRPEAIKQIILMATHKHLTGEDYDLNDLVTEAGGYRIVPMWMDTRNDSRDSINGVYVPVDLVDACRELDKLLDDSTKVEIVKLGKEFGPTAHHQLGMWIRNNWGLWGGSRLQAYLREKGYGDPDEMSMYLLNCYQFWLESKSKSEE